MIISLIFGIIIGAVTVVFALQNTAIVTVAFLSWQLTQPLAFLLLACMLGGILLALLVLLPIAIRDEFLVRAIRREKRIVETDFAQYRAANPPVRTEPQTTVTETKVFSA